MTGHAPGKDETRADEPVPMPPPKKASIGQVASTMFWALFMVGKKGTWEKDGATITLTQAIVGAVIALFVVLFFLVTIVRLAVG